MENEQINASDIDVILTSFTYSKSNIRDSQITPYELKNAQLKQIENVESKLRILKSRLLEIQ